MKLNFFNRKSNEIKELQNQIFELTNQVEKGVTNDSLMAFNNGRVEWYNISNNSYKDHYVVYRGIDMLANLGSMLKPKIYKNDQVMDDDFMLPRGFNIFLPNPDMSFNEIMYNALIYFFYRGELFIEISQDPFMYLNPLNPQHMTRQTNEYDWRYSYKSENRIISGDNIIYVKLLDPDKPERGISPIDIVKQDLNNEKSAIRYNTSYFDNYGKIGGMFYDSEGKARPADMKNIVDDFVRLHSGSNKAHKALGLPGGIRYEDFQKTMREMEYLKSRQDIRDRILALLGIHKSLFGVTDQVNRSVAEEATRLLWIHNLKPKMIRIQEKFNQSLFRRYFSSYKLKFDFSDIAELKQGIESLKQKAELLRSLGYTTNEINAELNIGMKDMPDDPILNTRFIPTNMVPADDLLVAPDIDTSRPKNDNNKSLKVLDEFFNDDGVAPEIGTSKPDIETKSNHKLIQKYKREYNKLRRSTQANMANKMKGFFSKEYGDIIKIILNTKNLKESSDLNSILAKIMNKLQDNKELLQKIMKPEYKEASIYADQIALDMLESNEKALVSDDVVNSLVNKISGISNHTYILIRTQLKIGVQLGETVDDYANRIKKIYKFNSARARTIARTEAGNVIHQSTDVRYKKAGCTKKEWINTNDALTRDSHRHNGEAGVVEYNHVYDNGQVFPNDGKGTAADNINCRCTYIGIPTKK